MSGLEAQAHRRQMDQVHDKAKSSLRADQISVEENFFAVAVLHPEVVIETCTAQDFRWFKIRGRYNLDKVQTHCNQIFGRDVTLHFLSDSDITGETRIRDLNHWDDHIVVFTTKYSENEIPRSASTPSLQARPPLASLPVNNTSPRRNGYVSPKQEDQSVPRPSLGERFAQARSPALASRPSADSPSGSTVPTPSIKHEPKHTAVKDEDPAEDTPMPEVPDAEDTEDIIPAKTSQSVALQKLIETASPEELEAELKRSKIFLKALRAPLADKPQAQQDADHWLKQIEQLQQRQVDTPTVIGVVGNTGAGKSSVINAMLDEERLVPTNCMRACTAVVTEMSWNKSNQPYEKYRAEIEFIQPDDWKKDLSISLRELLDMNGNVSKESSNPDTEAGVAYAKIKAVYPNKTKEMLANSSVEELMNDSNVKNILGKTRKINTARPEHFYRELQHFVDSKEKSTGEKKKDKGKKEKEKRQMEFWPLIKVVRIYTKSEALSTGAVIVDLPGVHDSNAARAAVANGYMKSCTGLWIVAPINRAVDDKAAKSLLGESFKRQLKYDGTYSRVTFICSKTDDISVTEASESLDLTEEMEEDWTRMDQINKEIKTLRKKEAEVRDAREVYTQVINDADDELEIWETLRDDVDEGKEVFAPTSKSNSKKRKRSSKHQRPKKKFKKSSQGDGDMDRFVVDDDDDDVSDGSEDDSNSDADEELEKDKGEPLTEEMIDAKISDIKANKKEVRRQKLEIADKAKKEVKEIEKLEAEKAKIDGAMSAICIAGRNQYSKGAIQQDFAAGIKELDQENAQELDEENFNPDEDMRDYEEVARSLPVFCVSSRAYQKLCGRMQRDAGLPAFSSVEETEIPQLQAHCKMLTEAGRASNCRHFLIALSQILNSLNIWASDDGTGLNLSDAQLNAEARFLKSRLKGLEEGLDNAVTGCMEEMKQTLAEHIFDNYDNLVEIAVSEANATVNKWGSPVNRDCREMGGFYWATYKAICRREGLFSNAQGTHDFNAQLCEPIMKHLANHWERVFAQRMPNVLKSFSRTSKNQLNNFHRVIEDRGLKQAISIARLNMLSDQIKNYEASFVTMTQQLEETINTQQRDANREFVPVIAKNLASSYQWCTEQSGPGQFLRMKHYMSTHVDSRRMMMFREAVEEVRKRLNAMCRAVENQMSEITDTVFMQMTRDYNSVISGTQLPEGQVMPKWERQMRAQLARIIEGREVGSETLEEEEVVEGEKKQEDAEEEEEINEEDEPTAEDEDNLMEDPSNNDASLVAENNGELNTTAAAAEARSTSEGPSVEAQLELPIPQDEPTPLRDSSLLRSPSPEAADA